MSSPQDVETAIRYVDRALHEVRAARRQSENAEADLLHIRELLMGIHPGNPLSPFNEVRKHRSALEQRNVDEGWDHS